MRYEHELEHRAILAQLADRHGLWPADTERQITSIREGCGEYGEHNHHRPDYSPVGEALEELDDAFEQLSFVLERERLGIEDVPTEVRADYGRLLGGIAECIRLCKRIIAARGRRDSHAVQTGPVAQSAGLRT